MMKKLIAAILALALVLPIVCFAETDGPSPWAAEGVQEAVALGMVPEGLQSDWQKDLTRGEFAQLLIQFLAAQYGYGNRPGSGLSLETFFEDYPSRRPAPDGTSFSKADYLTAEENNTPGFFYSWQGLFSDRVNVFEDVEPGGLAAYINLAYLLGVVKGRDERHYDPDGPITRQEAAALLCRTYQVYGALEPKEAEPFADADAIASWATADVAAMAGWDILHGDENRVFSPLAHYTREQGVLAFLRLYKNMPVSRSNGTLAPLLTRAEVVERCRSGGPSPWVLFEGETELCTVLCMSYGGVMHPPEPTVFLIYPNSTFKRIEVSDSPQDFHLTDHTLTFATGYFDQRNSLDLVTGTLTEGPVSETDQPHDSPETAMVIYPDDAYQCLLLNDQDEDWYQVTFPQDGTAEFTLSCFSLVDTPVIVYLYQHADSNYFPITREDLSRENPQVAFIQDVKANKPYFVRVYGDSGIGSARYTLRARLLPPSDETDYKLRQEEMGRLAAVEGFYHRPFEELPRELRDRLTFVREEPNAYGFSNILREYTAPGITVTTSQATEEALQRWLDIQLSIPAGHEDRAGTDEELYAEFEREKGREWLYSVDITDDSYATDLGLRVGTTVAQAEALGYLYPLGQPLTTDGVASYGDTWNHQVDIYTENGVVTKLHLSWALGRYAGKYWDP